jgi:elongation factor Ts
MAITTDLIKTVREKSGAGMLDCKKALEACDCDVERACDWLREKGIAKAAKKADRIAAEGLCSIKAEANKAAILEVNSETDFAAKSAPFVELVNQLTDYVYLSDVKTAEEALNITTEEGTVETVLQAATGRIGEKMTLRRCEVITKTDAQSFGYYIHMGGKIGVLVVVEGNGDLSAVAKDVAMHVAAINPQFVKLSDIPAEFIANEKHIQLEAAKNDPKLANKPEKILEGIITGKVNKTLAEICLVEQPFVKDPSLTVGNFVKSNGAEIVKVVRYGVGEGIQKKTENFAEEVAKQMK